MDCQSHGRKAEKESRGEPGGRRLYADGKALQARPAVLHWEEKQKKHCPDHGYDIRSANGHETRRYIKFDEENMSLFLEVRLPGSNKWIKIRPDQARGFMEEKERAEYQSIRRGLMLPTKNGTTNANLVPLGGRPARGAVEPVTSGLTASTSGTSSKWIPPLRQPSTPRIAGYALRNSSQK